MTGSLRLAKLVCPRCGNEVWLDVPRVVSLVYTCEKCETAIEQSFLTGTVTVKSDPPPSSSG